jgi:acetyltransferase-like isoleucine patch superfamily enzyme
MSVFHKLVRMFRLVFKNPITAWLNWLVLKIKIQSENSALKIGYMGYAKNSKFGKKNYIGDYSYLSKTEIGDFSYVSTHTSISNCKIGKFCSIGPNVFIGTGTHPTGFISTHPAFYSTGKPFPCFADKNYVSEYSIVTIGNDVWIGANSILMDGIWVGDGAIVGCGAIVTKDVPPYAIVVGVPAKIIGYRFSEVEINKLQRIKWWDLPEQELKNSYQEFMDVSSFFAHRE